MARGGLMQLLAYGPQDIYLTNNITNVTHWNVSYKRRLHFGRNGEGYNRRYVNFEVDQREILVNLFEFPTDIKLNIFNETPLFKNLDLPKEIKENQNDKKKNIVGHIFKFINNKYDKMTYNKQNQKELKSQIKRINRR